MPTLSITLATVDGAITLRFSFFNSLTQLRRCLETRPRNHSFSLAGHHQPTQRHSKNVACSYNSRSSIALQFNHIRFLSNYFDLRIITQPRAEQSAYRRSAQPYYSLLFTPPPLTVSSILLTTDPIYTQPQTARVAVTGTSLSLPNVQIENFLNDEAQTYIHR